MFDEIIVLIAYNPNKVLSFYCRRKNGNDSGKYSRKLKKSGWIAIPACLVDYLKIQEPI